MKEHKININNNFIEGYYLSDLSICDNLINTFEKSDKKALGRLGKGELDKKRKDSLDLGYDYEDIAKKKILHSYFLELTEAMKIYKQKYIFCNQFVSPWSLESGFNIQKYKPKQGYHTWHCEKATPETAGRHIVWMTYLNTVKEGGETEWYYQKLKVKPEKGLTIFWPADWTFTHKGHTTVDEDKYIITGWYNFD